LKRGEERGGGGDNDMSEICGNNAGIGEQWERGRNRRKGREREREDRKPTALPPSSHHNLSAPRKKRHPPI